jgi:hypothetical protein
MKAEEPRTRTVSTENVVSQLKRKDRGDSRLMRTFMRRVLPGLMVALALGAAFVPFPRARGVLFVLLVASVIGWSFSWLQRADERLTDSGREMKDYSSRDGF